MAGTVFPARVATTSPLTVVPAGDRDTVRLPVVNTSGLTLSVHDQVRVRHVGGGGLSEVTGRVG